MSSQRPSDAPEVSDQFAAHVLWMGEGQLLPGRPYWLKLGTRTVGATVTSLKHKVDIDTQAPLAATHLSLNEVGYCNLSLDQAIPFEPYARNRALGGFILIDRIDNATVAAGTLDFALRRAGNLHWQHIDVDKATRARSLGQAPRCVWFTGLSGSGKSTIANLVDKRLHAMGKHAFVLDGDNVRHGLNRDLGFTDEDRVENLRRVAEVAKLMTDAGLIVLVSFISPFRGERAAARAMFDEGEFIEVFVDTPLAVAESRDVKGLYAKARRGELPNFTGIDSPYEAPEAPELRAGNDGRNAGGAGRARGASTARRANAQPHPNPPLPRGGASFGTRASGSRGFLPRTASQRNSNTMAARIAMTQTSTRFVTLSMPAM